MKRTLDDLRKCAKNCTTHHNACDCIELKRAERDIKIREKIKSILDDIEIILNELNKEN